MKQISQFAVQNYVITPAALAVGQAPAANISNQKWQVTLSGVAMVDVKCTKSNDWSGETLQIPTNIRTAMQYAINRFNIPVPTDSPYVISSFDLPPIVAQFQAEQHTIFAALGSIYDQNTAVNAGFSVNNWRPVPFGTYTDSRPGGTAPPVERIFNGVLIDVAVRDIDAWLYRISYQVTLLGRIIFFRTQGM